MVAGFTVTCAVAETPSPATVAVIVAAPGDTAVTWPEAFTVATLVADEAKPTVAPDSPETVAARELDSPTKSDRVDGLNESVTGSGSVPPSPPHPRINSKGSRARTAVVWRSAVREGTESLLGRRGRSLKIMSMLSVPLAGKLFVDL
jgi:hypothetical protein